MIYLAFLYGLGSTVLGLLLLPGALRPRPREERGMVALSSAMGIFCGVLDFAGWAQWNPLPLGLNLAIGYPLSLALRGLPTKRSG